MTKKYLKVDIPLSQEDFDKIIKKVISLGLVYRGSLKLINGYKVFLKKYENYWNYPPQCYIYRCEFLKNEVSSNRKPPQKRRWDDTTKSYPIYGKEITFEEFLKL